MQTIVEKDNSKTQLLTNRKNYKRILKDSLAGYLFLLPALILFILFVAGPLCGIVYLCFVRYNMLGSPVFIGLKNFTQFFHDPLLRVAYWNTFKFVIIIVPLHVILGLILALGATRKISNRWKSFYRTVFYIPVLVPSAAVAIAWSYIYNTNFGVANYFLSKLGAKPIPWLESSTWVYVAIAIFSIWKFVGNDFLYYLIGLQNIDPVYYEAAQLDGANRFQIFFRVTLPMLTPTIFFVIVTTIIGAIQIFDEPYLITGGGPGDASESIELYIYQKAFQFHSYGYASAVSLSLFIIILIITVIQFKLSNKWVSYDEM